MNRPDEKTADAFATSWNNLPEGSVYTFDQFKDWMNPLSREDVEGKRLLELGCGNASLMIHAAKWSPLYIEGVDLGESVASANANMNKSNFKNWKIIKADLVDYNTNGFDVVYCIGVIHHLKDPKKGLDAVIRNTKPGGKFHVWVYAKEGNGLIIWFVDPIRKVVSHLPWWFTKYFVATPLVIPYFLYAKFISFFRSNFLIKKLPLYEYSLWISQQKFIFFRHVAFDQLVTPQTIYIKKSCIEEWLKSFTEIDEKSVYITMRNGNSWKFGGIIKNT